MPINPTAPAGMSNLFGGLPSQEQIAAPTKKPKAKFWINIGYMTGDEDYPFCSLPAGIPLDTTDELEIRGQNAKFNMFRKGQNELLKQFKDVAESLEPGQDRILQIEGGLALQIRRVHDEAATTDDSQNPFVSNVRNIFEGEQKAA